MQKVRAEIDLGAIRANARRFAALAGGAALCAVVKADAYGHGAVMVAHALRGIARSFAVALVEEGVALRQAGVSEDILVLVPPLCKEEVLRGCAYGLTFSLSDASDAALIGAVCERFGLTARCHIKVNTGMNRFGFDGETLDAFLRRPRARLRVEGIASHFYRPEDAATAEAQYRLFREYCARAEAAFGPLQKHIAATGGVLASSRYSADMVRVGIGLYGYVPNGFASPRLRRAMRVYATVASVRRYAGGGMGYGARRPNGENLFVLRCGYADGLFRAGTLCMDACVAEGRAEKYGEVCILSDADAVAAANGTIAYEVLARIGGRAVRDYVDR